MNKIDELRTRQVTLRGMLTDLQRKILPLQEEIEEVEDQLRAAYEKQAREDRFRGMTVDDDDGETD